MKRELNVRIIIRYNSTEGWAALAETGILYKGEIGLEYISDNSIPKMKIGDGVSTWENLPYFETSLPQNITWGDLGGTSLETNSSQTTTLELNKPGLVDKVDIADLNRNFDKIDNYYRLHTNGINTLGERITNLATYLAENPSEWSELEAEVLAARTVNGTTYSSLSNALDALNNDLQLFKIELEDIIGKAMPSKLVMDENGILYLADSSGTPIGEGTLVKDNNLKVLEKEVNRLKAEAIPDGLIYSNNQLYLAVQNEPIGDPVEITGGGGGGGNNLSYTVSLTNELDSRIISVAEKTPVVLKFNYTSMDKEEMDDGAGSGELLIDNVKITGFTVPQGSRELDVTPYLQKGVNNIKIKVTNSEGSYRSLTYTVTVVALSISSNFPAMGVYNSNSVAVQYTVNGEGSKTVFFVLTKQIAGAVPQVLGSETITSSGQSRQFNLARPASSGPYTLQIYAITNAGEIVVSSNIISFGMIWYDETDVSPFILMSTEQTEATEGEAIRIPYLVFHPAYAETAAEFKIIQRDVELEDGTIGNKLYSTQTSTVDRVSKTWVIQTFPIGKVSFEIKCGSASASVDMDVAKSAFDKTIIQNGLLLEFNATGRQNSDDNKDQWEYNGVKAEFNNVGWSSIDGWYLRDKVGGAPGEKEEQTVLRLLPGSSMTIPFYPFENNITSTGYTIEAEIATQNVSDYDSIIAESFSEGRGFMIKSQSAKLSSTGTSISAQFKEDEKVRLTFVVEQYTSSRLVTIYINGVSCGIQQYPENDIFTHPYGKVKGITIGADSCGIDIYFIRFYNVAFSATQQLNNYIVDRPTLAERIALDNKNDIINENADELAKKITINSLKGSIPYIIMECPELPQFKGDKKKGMSFSFVDPNNPERSFSAENVQFDVQGTSSAGYPVKNFKLKLGKLEEGGGITYTQSQEKAKGFKFRGDDSLITKVFCLKADYASSENTNNVMLVDYYNQTCPYRNDAQKADERVRWSVHGEPIVLFWRNTKNNEIYFQGKYNMNDDKDNENVFGFVDILDEEQYPNIECWEFLNNNTALCLFSHPTDENNSAWFEKVVNDKGEEMDAWENSYERRFPEQDDDTKNHLGNLQRMINWVASTNRNRAFSSTPLAQEVYYRTMDKTYAGEGKQYYEYVAATNSYNPKTISLFDAVRTYDDKVTIIASAFKQAIHSVQPDLSLYHGWVCERGENGWTVYYDDRQVVLTEVQNLESIGIGIGSGYTGVNVVFEYYLGNDWNNALYEKHTHDTADYRLAKFKNEFTDYFVLDAAAFFYIYTEVFLLMDSRAKNMFLMTFDGQHWFPSPYDMDTALGINNEGQLVFDYNLEDTDTSSGSMIYDGKNKLYDGTNTYTGTLNTNTKVFTTTEGQQIQYDGSLVFNGQESVLWNNFRDCFGSEIETMYRSLRSQDGSENGQMKFSYEAISKKMEQHQDMWPEVLWNIDQEIKYLQPFYAGTDNLKMAQGDKRTQRNFWAFNTFKYRDSKYKTADSVNNYIHLRIYSKGTISITPYSHIYARVEFGNAKDEQKRAFRNEVVEFNTDGITTVNDLETHIFSSDRISKIGDLSPFRVGYCDFSMAPKLQEIIVGSEEEGYLNGNLTTFMLGASELLHLVDISNCYNLTGSIDASRCPTLKTFKAKGTAISGVNFSTGGRLEEFYLPKTITNLTLREQSHLKKEGIHIDTNEDGTYNLTTLWIDATPSVDFFNILINSPKLEYVRLTNIDWKTNEEELHQFYDIATRESMGSLNENGGAVVGHGAVVTGKAYVDSIDGDFLAQMNDKFPNLTIHVKNESGDYNPKFFIKYVTYNNKLLYSYLAEGGAAAIDPTTDESVPEWLRTSILETIQARPNTDSNGDGTIDTFYELNEEEPWDGLPTKITQSYVVIPSYKVSYLTRYYFDKEKTQLLYSTKVYQNDKAIDPTAENLIEKPQKDKSAQFTFTYAGWSPNLMLTRGPVDYVVSFEEIINKYNVEIYGGDKVLSRQYVAYGSMIILPPAEEVKLYYLDEKGEDGYSCYEIYEHIDWDEYIGEEKVEFGNKDGITILPPVYTEETIKIRAVFAPLEPTTSPWWEIIESCEKGTYKSKYPIGTQKAVEFAYKGKTYTGILEVVDQDYDVLEDGSTAHLTLILKNAFERTRFRIGTSQKWYYDPENPELFIDAPLAGGWTNDVGGSGIYTGLKGIIFSGEDSSILNDHIKTVLKKTDFGPIERDAFEYFPTKVLPERIWTPSALEMGVLTDINEEMEEAQQGGDGTKGTYAWFTTNASRIKTYNDVPTVYFTRTWKDSWRFFGVNDDGGYGLNIINSAITNDTRQLGLRSYDPAGIIFGICL